MEIIIFFRHVFAILYGRSFLAIRDVRSLFCQVILPSLFALVGLAIIQLVFTVNNPKIEMSINQWYSSNDYIVPMGTASNVESSEINNKFSINDNYLNLFNQDLESSFGKMELYEYQEASTGEYTDIYQTENISRIAVYNQRSDNKINQYNAFWAPEVLCDPSTGCNNSPYNLENSPIYCILNVSAVHSMPIAYNMLNNWILRYKLQNVTTSSSAPSITFYAYPFSQTVVQQQWTNQFSGILVRFILSSFPLCIVSIIMIYSGFVIFDDCSYIYTNWCSI